MSQLPRIRTTTSPFLVSFICLLTFVSWVLSNFIHNHPSSLCICSNSTVFFLIFNTDFPNFLLYIPLLLWSLDDHFPNKSFKRLSFLCSEHIVPPLHLWQHYLHMKICNHYILHLMILLQHFAMCTQQSSLPTEQSFDDMESESFVFPEIVIALKLLHSSSSVEL